MHDVSICDTGAIGNGRADDTVALQRAIDQCAGAGGGRVYCPPGVYLIGSVELRSHVDLHVGENATLLASPDRVAYVKRLPFDAMTHNEQPANFDECLFYASGARSFSITGRGTIDGNGRAFFVPDPANPTGRLRVREWRPGMMLTLVDCRDVLIRDIHLTDAPCYSLFLLGCEQLRIDGATIDSDRMGVNTDGIDLFCCRDVRISNCSISTGDDCITCYSMPGWLRNPRPCENIAVTNCTLTTRCCGVRIGYAPSDLPIRNVVFSNLVMHNTRTGIDLLSPLESALRLPCEPLARHGPLLENISFNNIVMETQVALYVWVDPKVSPPAGIRNISLSNITATTQQACFVGGTPAAPVDGLRIDNMSLVVNGEVSGNLPVDPPEEVSRWGCPGVPHAFYMRHGRNVTLSRLHVSWDRARGPWRSALRARDVHGLDICSVSATPGARGRSPVVHLSNVREAFLHDCRGRCQPGYLHIDGSAPSDAGSLIGD